MVAQKRTKETTSKVSAPVAHGVGRRKKSIARIWLRRGNGKITVNGKNYSVYFDTEVSRLNILRPFSAVPQIARQYDIEAYVIGGGRSGQSDAVKLGISRALVSTNENIRSILRDHRLLTVDARVKERKKYGQKAARRKFQFVKR
jgi:small subunit ribosomal protein S9